MHITVNPGGRHFGNGSQAVLHVVICQPGGESKEPAEHDAQGDGEQDQHLMPNADSD
ncbi:MAG: hypothetical protein KAS81_06235 [Anaerolineales bacterium]|nr:hypothetical protein [Anaerolineales bacterium]